MPLYHPTDTLLNRYRIERFIGGGLLLKCVWSHSLNDLTKAEADFARAYELGHQK